MQPIERGHKIEGYFRAASLRCNVENLIHLRKSQEKIPIFKFTKLLETISQILSNELHYFARCIREQWILVYNVRTKRLNFYVAIAIAVYFM